MGGYLLEILFACLSAFYLFVCFDTKFHVSQAGFELTM